MQPALQFLDRHLDAPPSGVITENLSGTRSVEIGHDDLGFLRPIISPLLRENDRDITDVFERPPALVYPIITPPAIRLQALQATVLTLRQVLHQIAQGTAIRELAGARRRKHIAVAEAVEQAEGLRGGEPGVGLDHDLPRPLRRHELPQHPPEENVLLPLPARVNNGDGHGHAVVRPTGDEQDQLEPVAEAGVLVDPAGAPQRVLPPALAFDGGITDEV